MIIKLDWTKGEVGGSNGPVIAHLDFALPSRHVFLSKTSNWFSSLLVNTHVSLPYSKTGRIKVL
jgi:hypothetical protein